MIRSPARWLPVVLLALSGCQNGALQGLGDIVRAMAPTTRLDHAELTRVDWDGAAVDLHLAVDNPNPIGVRLASFDWQVDVAEHPLLSGVAEEGLDIAASGSSTLRFPVALAWTEVGDVVTDVRERTEVPLRLAGSMAVRTPVGPVTVPVDVATTVPVLHIPRIEPVAVRVGPIDLLRQRVELQVVLAISHRFAQTAAFKDMRWALTMDGRPLVDGQIAEVAAVEPGQTAEIVLPVGLNLLQAGAAIVSKVREPGPVAVDLTAGLSVATPFGDLPLSVDASQVVDLVSGLLPAPSP